MTIAAAADRAPPLVTLTAPKQALPGATVTITVGASDNDTVSSVVLAIEGEAPTHVHRGALLADLHASGDRVARQPSFT